MDKDGRSFEQQLKDHIYKGLPEPAINISNLQQAQIAFLHIDVDDILTKTPPDELVHVCFRLKFFGDHLDQLFDPPIDRLSAEIREVREEDVGRGQGRK